MDVHFFFPRESESTSSLLSDPRVNLLTNGGLEISNVTHDDEGLYICSVENTNMSVNAQLEVLSESYTNTHRRDLFDDSTVASQQGGPEESLVRMTFL